MTVKTDRFWELTATLGDGRPPCEMPLGKEGQIRAYGMCGIKATDLCGKPATECAWCSDDCDGHLLCRECNTAVCGDYFADDAPESTFDGVDECPRK